MKAENCFTNQVTIAFKKHSVSLSNLIVDKCVFFVNNDNIVPQNALIEVIAKRLILVQ